MQPCKLKVLILFLLVSAHSCSEPGNMFGNANQLPGTSYAHANGNQGGEISLVSLIYPDWEEIEGLSIVDRITGLAINGHSKVVDGNTIVTLELIRGRLANPYLTFLGKDISFTALLTPGHSLSTFGGLSFGKKQHTVFLRDHGVEREVIAGDTSTLSSEDYVVLWIGDRLASAVRVHLVNPGAAEEFEVSAPGCEALVKKKNQLHKMLNLKLGDYESASLVIAPHSGEETICLSVVAR